ncbi:MAG: ribosomal L7Ae/L30e/S12e/Gadd45 family protein [Clostridia bacterium]
MPNDSDRIYPLVGLAKKAGKTVTGSELCIKEMSAGKVILAIVAEDASDNTKKRIRNACAARKIEYVEYGVGEMLGKMTGSDNRMVVGIKDKNLGNLILSRMHVERS